MSLFQSEQISQKIRDLLVREAVDETLRHEAAFRDLTAAATKELPYYGRAIRCGESWE